MPENYRRWHRQVTLHHMKITVTYPSRFHSHQDFTRLRRKNLDLLDDKWLA
jgi:hypothetical protein